MNTELMTIKPHCVFSNKETFESGQRMATALSNSNLVPKEYKNNMPNCLIALEIAQRTEASPFMVMQNLDIIHGRPSWRSQFIISAINSCGRFRPLQFHLVAEEKEKNFKYEVFETEWVNREKVSKLVKRQAKIRNKTCIAWTTEKNVTLPQTVFDLIKEEQDKGEQISVLEAAKALGVPLIEGPEVSIEMACAEGWYDKSGSKWKTMDELMLRYRAAAFFGRIYAPEVLMGVQTAEEVHDAQMKDVTPGLKPSPAQAESINEILTQQKEDEIINDIKIEREKEVSND